MKIYQRRFNACLSINFKMYDNCHLLAKLKYAYDLLMCLKCKLYILSINI